MLNGDSIYFLTAKINLSTTLCKLFNAPSPSSLGIELRPAVHFRPLEATVDQDTVNPNEYALTTKDNIYQISGGNYPPLLIQLVGDHSFNIDNHRWDNIYFRLEYERGYASVGKHWSPGFFKLALDKGQSIALIATTEDVDNLPSSFDESLLQKSNGELI